MFHSALDTELVSSCDCCFFSLNNVLAIGNRGLFGVLVAVSCCFQRPHIKALFTGLHIQIEYVHPHASLLSYQVLLSLGASPNYKDRCGLTPLYHTVLTGGDTTCCETLLYYRARLGTRDENGWEESHQVPMDSLRFLRGTLQIQLCSSIHGFLPYFYVKGEEVSSKIKMRSLSTHHHANGKSGEATLSVKHFWSFVDKLSCSILLNNCRKVKKQKQKKLKRPKNGSMQLVWHNPSL